MVICKVAYHVRQRRIILLALRGCRCEAVSLLLFFGYSFHPVGFSPLLHWNRLAGRRDGLLQVYHPVGLTVGTAALCALGRSAQLCALSLRLSVFCS